MTNEEKLNAENALFAMEKIQNTTAKLVLTKELFLKWQNGKTKNNYLGRSVIICKKNE